MTLKRDDVLVRVEALPAALVVLVPPHEGDVPPPEGDVPPHEHRSLEHVWIACIMPLHIQRTELLLVVASEGDAMARGEVQGHAKANASIFSNLNKPSISPHDLTMQKAT